ncbi:MAG: peptide ABC transporter substrate-binding protein [Betaproteobacteria bacterium]|nr:peptide ABC transporter substrate-binding protein [Betaproteobacteria bacterium]
MVTLQATMRKATVLLLAFLALAGCGRVWNDPYPAIERDANILYSSFTERPKTLDPAKSYTSDEWDFISQIYEPPLQYHYLKRPYELIPQSAAAMPVVRYIDANGVALKADAAARDVAYSDYEIRIRPGIQFQPHPAFAKGADGQPLYLGLTEDDIKRRFILADFPQTGTRELIAEDYVYQIKRLAHPRLSSPVFSHIADYVVGLKELGALLQEANKNIVAAHQAKFGASDQGPPWIDLREFALRGVTVVDRYTYRIRVKGKYPQFLFWLAMPFFAPVPVEAEQFYTQRGMNDGRNLTLEWYPVGTGPYMLAENNPNARMVLTRNPHFRGEAYPAEGAPGDREEGLLVEAGKIAPFIDRIVYARERESIPYWNKFLQGYYDRSGVDSDQFDQAVKISFEGEAALSEDMERRGIQLRTSVGTSTFYMSFNYLDPVVGGPSARKLRQAISIAMDWEEFITIFQNGRGLPGMGPIPPGIFGHLEGEASINPIVYDWVDGKPRRKPIEAAKRLLAEAGYPSGRDAKTGAPLVLYLDTVQRGPGDKARLDWYRRQFAKLDIQLEIRATDWNRFQEKLRKGNTQLFFIGWNADYPDPENFLFLLHGDQGQSKFSGENRANYSNAEFDSLFDRMKGLPNGPDRQAVISRMVRIAQDDAPWLFAYHPKDYRLMHAWLKNVKPNQMARNGIKFQRIDVAERAAKREAWNGPVWWPVIALIVLLGASAIPAYAGYRRRERMAARRAPVRA